jgi:hypothetical protein
MAKRAARDTNLSLNAVALENFLGSYTQDLQQENIVTTGFADAGPRRVVANYDHNLSLDGNNDFASGALDATIFGLLGSAGVASDLDPTGAVAGPSAPHYTSTQVLESYSIKGGIGQAVTFSAKTNGAAALTRAVA